MYLSWIGSVYQIMRWMEAHLRTVELWYDKRRTVFGQFLLQDPANFSTL